jgi:predicted SnoaL-like aldol condensation-catalyzing enzyme
VESEEVKNLVCEYFRRLINEKDLSVCDELLSRDYVDHDAPADTPPGPESIKQYVTMFLHDYPDMQVHIEDIIAEGNKVAVRIIWRGNHRETGEKFHKMGIIILHLNMERQLTERWSAYEPI